MRRLIMIWRLILVFLPAGFVRIFSPGSQLYRGANIDVKARAVGRLANYIRVPGVMPSPQESRAQMRKLVTLFDKKGPQLAQVTDIVVKGAEAGLPARLYSNQPKGKAGPALVFFHGGGFIQGDLETHDALCRKLAAWSGGAVIAVAYRLAPEHPFPTGLKDAKAAFQDISTRADELGLIPDQIGIGGDSAGGCFSAVISQDTKDKPVHRPCFQVLIYPATDSRLNSNSIHDHKDGYIIPLDRMKWYRNSYLAEFTDFEDPEASPLLAKNFSGLPKSYILSGGFDPVLDDAKSYCEKLKTAGIDVTYRNYTGQIHGFLNLTKVIPQGTQAIRETADWMRKNWR